MLLFFLLHFNFLYIGRCFYPSEDLIVFYDFRGDYENNDGGSPLGLYAGTPTYTQDRYGRENSALFNDGTVVFHNESATNLEPPQLSIVAWFNITTDPGYQIAITRDVTYGYGLNIQDGGALRCFTYYSGTRLIVDYNPPDDGLDPVWDSKWHHVACAFDGYTLALFYDGVLRGTIGGGDGDLRYGSHNVYVAAGGATTYIWEGSIAEFGIYKRDLKHTEIKEMFDGAPHDGHLLARFEFGNSLVDWVSHNEFTIGDGGPIYVPDRHGVNFSAIQIDDSNNLFNLDYAYIQASALSVSMWFKTAQICPSDSFCLPLFMSNYGFKVYFLEKIIQLVLYTDPGAVMSIVVIDNVFNDDRYHHLAFTSDGITTKVYFDGKLADEDSSGGGAIKYVDTTLYLGFDMWEGVIDELRFYSKVLSEAEVLALYGVTAYYPLAGDTLDKGLYASESHKQLSCPTLVK